MIEIIIGDIFFSSVGFVYLFLKYRDKQKRQYIHKNQYDCSYRNIGFDLFLRVVAMSNILLIISFLLVVFYAVFKFGIA